MTQMLTSEVVHLVHLWPGNAEPNSVLIKQTSPFYLFRYAVEPHADGTRPFSYWTEALTDHPKLASEATGIFVEEAIWRATIVLTTDEINAWLEYGGKRGKVKEYVAESPIPAARLHWHKLESRATGPIDVKTLIQEQG